MSDDGIKGSWMCFDRGIKYWMYLLCGEQKMQEKEYWASATGEGAALALDELSTWFAKLRILREGDNLICGFYNAEGKKEVLGKARVRAAMYGVKVGEC